MTARRRCRAWDLAIRSDVSLPGAMALPPDDAAIDLDIAHGSAALIDPDRADGPYRIGRAAFEFTMPGVARYLCTAASIVVDQVPGAPADDVAAMLIATAIPAVLWTRGEVVLHAAAAIPPGAERAVAVLGRSGSGKSALLAQAAASGWRVVADDSVCLRAETGGFRISGLPGGYFAPLTADGGKRPFVAVPPDRQCASALVGAMIVLDDDRPGGRLTGADAVAAMLTHRHRPRISRLLGVEHHSFARLTRLCREVPIHTRPFSARSDIAALPTGS